MSKLKDLDYINKAITKPGWKTDKFTKYIKFRNRSYDPQGLYIYFSNGTSLYEKGYVPVDDEILESEGWIYYDG